ncbi:MAG: hypothetical protein LKK13_00430 [Bacilli bacterium]|jgi:hypothetical protein|nr:hypothetical protein [Bacilli bacterium]
MKETIECVGDEMGLSDRWLNDDFKETPSYSSRLVSCSVPYKTFAYVLSVRKVVREYLIATKLMAFRPYRSDQSDIVGILIEEKKKGNPVSFAAVDSAMERLYGGWAKAPKDSMRFLKEALARDDLESLFNQAKNGESKRAQALRRPNGVADATNQRSSEEIIAMIDKRESGK